MAIIYFAIVFNVSVQNAESKVSLHQGEVVVADDKLKLGDIFTGLDEEKQNIAIGDAPLPGKSYVLNKKQIDHINQYYDVRWEASQLQSDKYVGLQKNDYSLKVKRLSHDIGNKEIKDIIAASAKELQSYINSGENIDVTIYGDNKISLPINNNSDNSFGNVKDIVKLKSFNWVNDEKSFETLGVRAFVCLLEVNLSKKHIVTMVKGDVSRLINVPVLKRNLKAGELISSSVIEFIPMRKKDINNNTLLDPEVMVGKTSRFGALFKGKPILKSQVIAPLMVKRNDIIRVEVKSPKMRITMVGRAKSNGRMGDVIDIENTKSKSIIQARVVGKGLASMDII